MVQHEIGQFDIPNRQLVVIKKESKGDSWTDIGNAKITHTIFGRAKIRVIREKDKIRRTWLMAAMVSIALVGSVWLGWIAAQNAELLQSETAMPPVSIKPSEPPLTESGIPASDWESTPQQPLDLKASDRIGQQVEIIQSLTESKSQTEPHAKGKKKSQNESESKSSPKSPAAAQSAAPAAATPPASHPAEIRPATVVSPIEPAIKENTSIQSPAGNN